MMCVSAGKSEGEIAWRRCEGIGSRGHGVGWLERRSINPFMMTYREVSIYHLIHILLK